MMWFLWCGALLLGELYKSSGDGAMVVMKKGGLVWNDGGGYIESTTLKPMITANRDYKIPM